MKFQVGDRIWFEEEVRPYTVMAVSRRFLACSKPFAAVKNYIYTIVDLEKKVRGTDGYVFGLCWGTPQEARSSLIQFRRDGGEVSYRNNIPLRISKTAKKGTRP